MPQRFRYNARTGELSGITSLKLGDPQLQLETFVTNYIRDNARDVVYDSDLVVSTMQKTSGSSHFDSDQIVAIINENTGVGLSGFDSDQVNEIVREYLEDVVDDTGFDSDQVVSIINENVNAFDSDQVVAIINENVPVAGFDSEQINTIINEYSGFMPELQVNPDEDSDVIAAVVNIVNTQIFTDSDRDLVSNLRSDLDSESIEVRALRADFDSDSTILKTLNSQESVSSLRSDLDSETARIQLLFSNADSDQINIAILRRDADSDSIAIQNAKTRAENDAALIGLLRAELDSETSRIEELQDNLDSESSVISSIRSDLDSESSEIRIIRSDLDSDSIKIQQNDSDIKNLYSRIEAVEADSTFSGLTARLDSDENQLQLLSTRIDTVTSVNSTQNANIQKLFDNADSETSRIQIMLLRIDSDEQQLQTINERINSVITLLDSESIEIRALRADLDSESSIISQLRVDIDSDSTKIQDIQTQLDSESAERKSQDTNINNLELEFAILRSDVDSDLNAFDIQANASFDSDQVVAIINENSQGLTDSDLKSIADLRDDVDSDSLKIQSLTIRVEDLESGADSDRTAIAQLRRDADSDSTTIQSIRGAVDSDYALFNNKIELFNGLTDSDLTTVSILRNDLDSESAVISKLRADLDSDFTNRPTGFDSDQIVAIIGENALSSSSTGRTVLLGTEAYDSEYQSPRAVVETFDSDTSITSAIDQLNEAMHNVLNSTAVTNVSFTADQTSGGEGMNVTLTINADGNPNRYDVYWGDGETTDSDTSDSTPSHTYSDNTNTPFSVRVVARNNNGRGAGSFAESLRNDYIVLYGADPVASFAIYLQSAGGSAVNLSTTGVETEQTIWFENTTSNTSGQEATFEIEWGDGDSDSVSNTEAGGVDGNRISHTYTTDSGTGRHTIQLTLQTHNTANPSVIPLNTTSLIKVYDSEIAAPAGLSAKTISAPSSTGTSPRAASGFTDNVSGGTTINAGDSVTRTTGTGTVSSSIISTYAHNAASGTLSANVDGSTDGSKAFSTGDDSGTYTSLVVTEDIDAQAINSTGSTVSFASSIYAPNKYEVFKARVSKSNLSAGSHSYQLSHDVTGSTNTVHFIHDDITSTPSISSAGTLAENAAGTYRYISGIPYYNSGSPSLTLSGTSISNISGQTYSNISDPVEVESGTSSEGSGDAIANQDYTYANIDGSTTFLSGGIPLADTGVSSPYSIGNLTVPITSSSLRVVDNLRIRGTNVNGSGSYSNITSHKVAVHTAAQSGISEIAIAVADALGATYDDDGVRIQNFNAEGDSDTPEFNGATNYYTNNPYTESTTITSTHQEAAIRIGTLQHNVVDYSSGYLPAGPDRSGLTGRQYFTFAFRRSQVSSFNLNITSSTGVGGVWIAAPGTSIDSASGLSGWLNCGAQYAGSGVPGSDTGNGGNGSDGCASTGGDIIGTGSLSGSYTMTLGTVSSSNATGNVILVRIGLDSSDSITSLSIT